MTEQKDEKSESNNSLPEPSINGLVDFFVRRQKMSEKKMMILFPLTPFLSRPAEINF